MNPSTQLASQSVSQSVTLCHMCEVVLIKTERGLRLELKVSLQIAQVTTSDLIHTRGRAEEGEGEEEVEKVAEKRGSTMMER